MTGTGWQAWCASFRSSIFQLQAMRGKANSIDMNISRIDTKIWWWAR